MAGIRSRRQKLLDGMCRVILDRLDQRVADAARCRGMRPPETTSAIYALALAAAPGLLEQLFQVVRLVAGERPADTHCVAPAATDEVERRRMLSAVRASVGRVRLHGRTA